MKKIFLQVCLFLFVSAAYADNAVFLDLDNNDSNSQDVQSVQKGSVNMSSMDVKYTPDAREKERETLLYKDVNRMQAGKTSVSKSIEKEVLKNTSVGATYSTTEKSGNLKDTVSVYSKYEKEHFGITTAYSQNGDKLKTQGAAGGTVSLAPEVSINKHIKLKDVYSENMTNNQQKNEIVLSVRPFKDDRVDLDFGAGQTYSTSNQPAKSQISVGTKIRF